MMVTYSMLACKNTHEGQLLGFIAAMIYCSSIGISFLFILIYSLITVQSSISRISLGDYHTCKYSSLSWVCFVFSGTSPATPRVLRLSGCSSSSGRSSIRDTPVTETNLPRNSGPHQGGVSVPPDPVPQVGVGAQLGVQTESSTVCRNHKGLHVASHTNEMTIKDRQF